MRHGDLFVPFATDKTEKEKGLSAHCPLTPHRYIPPMSSPTPTSVSEANLSMWQPHRPERPAKSEGGKTFRLVSEFEPKGDQVKAIPELVDGLNSIERDQVLLGVTGSGKTFTMAKVIEQTQRPALIMAPNKTLAAQLYSEFKSFFPDNAVEYFVSYYDYYQPEAYVPRTDTFIEKDSSVNEQIDRMRHAATRAILERDDCIIAFQNRACCRMTHAVNLLIHAGIFFDESIRPRHIGFGLIIIIIRDEIFDGIIREETFKLGIKLRGQCLIGRHDKSWALGLFNDLSHCESLA